MSASPPALRRIITGHDQNGKAIIESDTKLEPMNPFTSTPASFDPTADNASPFAFSLIHRTSGFPASNTEPFVEYHGKKIGLEHKTGTICRVVDFAPMQIGPDGKAPEGFMHRTQSLDFAVILKGKIILELDDKVETEVREGEIVVQRGTIHAWKNLSDELCRILFVLLPAEKVKNESTGEYLEITPTPTMDEEEK